MHIVSLNSEADGTFRIELSDGSLFSFKPCYFAPVIINENIYTPGADGLEITAGEEEALRFASACLRAEIAALRLIARAEQTLFGISRKLEKRGHTPACVRAVTARLCETGLLDDFRFASYWLESRISRQASTPRRLVAGLCARGIDRDDAEAALKNSLTDTELPLLERYVQKQRRLRKINDKENTDSAARRTLKYLLKSEGFSYSAIQLFFESEEV